MDPNAFSADFRPAGLKKILSGLRDRFFTKEEFPFIRKDLLPQNTLSTAMGLPASHLKAYAAGLKGRELDGLLLELRDAEKPEEMERGVRILELRWSERLAKLLTVLYQYNYNSKGLSAALRKLSQILEEDGKNGDGKEAAFIRRFGGKEDKFAAASEAIREHDMDIGWCFRDCKIQCESPFALEAALRFLNHAEAEGFSKNRSHVVRTLEKHKPEQVHRLINNYLSRFTQVEMDDGINLAILQMLGRDLEAPEWLAYDAKLRRRFRQWLYLHDLKMHSLQYPKKYAVLSEYYEQVNGSRHISEENLFLIDFGDLVISDISTDPFSHFCDKETFEKEMQLWENSKENQEPYRPVFLRPDKKTASARDFIIEEIEAPCVRLSYEGVDVLYIQEMLDIKMGLEPDMRRKQLEKLRKKIR